MDSDTTSSVGGGDIPGSSAIGGDNGLANGGDIVLPVRGGSDDIDKLDSLVSTTLFLSLDYKVFIVHET